MPQDLLWVHFLEQIYQLSSWKCTAPWITADLSHISALVLGLDPEAWIQNAVRSGSVMPLHTAQDTAGAPPASSLGGIFTPDLTMQCIPTEISICSIATLQIQD